MCALQTRSLHEHKRVVAGEERKQAVAGEAVLDDKPAGQQPGTRV